MRDDPAFTRADQHQFEPRIGLLNLKHLADVSGAFDFDVKRLAARYHRHQRCCISAGEQIAFAAPTPCCKIAGLAQSIAKLGIGCRPAAACDPCACLAQLDQLERARLSHSIRVCAQIDHRALSGKDRWPVIGRNQSPSDPGSAAYLHMLRGWVDRIGDIDAGVKARSASAFIVGIADRADIVEAQIGERDDDAGRHPFACAVNNCAR